MSHCFGMAHTSLVSKEHGRVSLRDRIGAMLRRPPVLAAAGALPFAILVLMYGGSTFGIGGFLAVLTAALAVTLSLRQYFRHRRTVDSRYKAIIDQTHDGIVIVDSATHRIQYCNPAFLARIGYTSAEARGAHAVGYFLATVMPRPRAYWRG